ncbi:hypothetical protein M8044_000501 [Columbia Basin potato purple top phytoplasma]|uniref:Uncharacterized protein n=1 Tax=Columbia Basin potato purple top phytoplasma TaxID=307134 RepID=A0ABT5L9K2_9MOLU|nr:hypothetical protein [Columbia Basin potato purple top phytoplasma]
MSLKQFLILVAISCIFIFAIYKLGYISPVADKIKWLK